MGLSRPLKSVCNTQASSVECSTAVMLTWTSALLHGEFWMCNQKCAFIKLQLFVKRPFRGISQDWSIISTSWATLRFSRQTSSHCVHSMSNPFSAATSTITSTTTTTIALLLLLLPLKTKPHGLSPRANYTYRVTAACRRSDCQLLRIEGATWSAWRIPTAVFSVF
jgi:hypothetical protein